MDLVVNEWNKYSQLAYIRKNVRIVMVPIVNPWGFANQERENVNNVDLNRNLTTIGQMVVVHVLLVKTIKVQNLLAREKVET